MVADLTRSTTLGLSVMTSTLGVLHASDRNGRSRAFRRGDFLRQPMVVQQKLFDEAGLTIRKRIGDGSGPR